MMDFKISTYSIWHPGQRTDDQGNPHQEDSLFPRHGYADAATDRLFVLCDGMGGHDSGEVASATVCEAIAEAVRDVYTDHTAPFTAEMLRQVLTHAYDRLDEADTNAAKKMGTTMTMLLLHGGGATVAHIGDSRVYHIRPGKDADSTRIVHVTGDHSLVNDLVKVGELTAEEALTYPRRNVLTRAMQPHTQPRCQADVYVSTDVRPGDVFYLCSDGMLENMDDSNIRFIFSEANNELSDYAAKVDLLLSVTKENSDNHSAYIVRIDDVTGQAAEADVTDVAAAPAATPEASAEKAKAAKAAPKHSRPSMAARPAGSGARVWVIAAIALALLAGALLYVFRSESPERERERERDILEEIVDDDTPARHETTSRPTERRKATPRSSRPRQTATAPQQQSGQPPTETEQPEQTQAEATEPAQGNAVIQSLIGNGDTKTTIKGVIPGKEQKTDK